MERVRGARGRVLVVVLAVTIAAAGCSSDDGGADGSSASSGPPSSDADSPAASPYEGYESDLYADPANWLCRPDLDDDVCARDLDATAVYADGTTEVQPHEAAADPPVDCFYVYPTTSSDEGANSDLEPSEAEEINTVYNQAARFNSVCRVFAPLYRQATLGMISGVAEVPEGVDPREVAYDDVLDAFRHYVAGPSEGRGFVLIGHSQGAAVLQRLIEEEIDGVAALRDRLVSALLLGWTLPVAEGERTGGSFEHVPVCEADDEVGCVVSYVSFRADAPPPADSFFGGVDEPGLEAACVAPAGDGDAPATLTPYFLVESGGLLGASTQPFADPARRDEITTPWVTFPDFVDAECVQDGEYHYLALTVRGDPADPRTDDIGGDLTPEWGMHLVDVNVALGDLVDRVARQAEAYSG